MNLKVLWELKGGSTKERISRKKGVKVARDSWKGETSLGKKGRRRRSLGEIKTTRVEYLEKSKRTCESVNEEESTKVSVD